MITGDAALFLTFGYTAEKEGFDLSEECRDNTQEVGIVGSALNRQVHSEWAQDHYVLGEDRPPYEVRPRMRCPAARREGLERPAAGGA